MSFLYSREKSCHFYTKHAYLSTSMFPLCIIPFQILIGTNVIQEIWYAATKGQKFWCGEMPKVFWKKVIWEYHHYLRWPLLEISASGFGVPLRAASCCSRAFDSKYSSHAAASCPRVDHACKTSDTIPIWSLKQCQTLTNTTQVHCRLWILQPECEGLLLQVWLWVYWVLFVRVAHSVNTPPLKKEQWQWHGSLQQSTEWKWPSMRKIISIGLVEWVLYVHRLTNRLIEQEREVPECDQLQVTSGCT